MLCLDFLRFGGIEQLVAQPALPGPAWVLLSKIYKPFSSPLYACFFGLRCIQRARKRFADLAKQDPGRVVKQEQEEISPNHVQAIYGASVAWQKVAFKKGKASAYVCEFISTPCITSVSATLLRITIARGV